MTTDREAACWLMAALLVVVLTFSAAGCSLGQQAVASDATFAAAAPLVRWTVRDEADVLPGLVAAAVRANADQREQGAALGFDPVQLGESAAAVPLFTLEQAAQLNAVVGPAAGVFEPATYQRDHELGETPEVDRESSDDDAAAASLGSGGPVAAGGALTDAATRGLRAAVVWLGDASPGVVALGLGGAAMLGFGLQALVLALSLREPAAGPVLTLGPEPTPFPRPPAGGVARPLPFARVAAFGVVPIARAA